MSYQWLQALKEKSKPGWVNSVIVQATRDIIVLTDIIS